MTFDTDHLMLRYLDGQCTGDEHAQLAEAMGRDEALRGQFVVLCIERRIMRESLRRAGSLEAFVGGANPDGSAVAPRSPGLRMAVKASLLLAAMIVIAATTWFLSRPQPHMPTAMPDETASPVAMLTNEDRAVMTGPNASVPLGGALQAGPIHLQSGKAQVMFNSTAVVDLTGPCEFEMTGLNRGRLTAGRIECYVPKQARGFSVELPDGTRVTDLGTRFSLRVRPAAADLIVLAGRVRLDSGTDSQILTAGVARRVIFHNDRSVVQAVTPGEVAPVSLNLADVLAGGDGTGDHRNRAISLFDGSIGKIEPGFATHDDGHYHAVAASPYIDGVFMPRGGGAVTVDSAGDRFTPQPPSKLFGWHHPQVTSDGVFYIHANSAVTIDLDALRARHLVDLARLEARLTHSLAEHAAGTCVLTILVDGRKIWTRKLHPGDANIPLDVALLANGRFMTLMLTDGGDGVTSDAIYIQHPRLLTAQRGPVVPPPSTSAPTP